MQSNLVRGIDLVYAERADPIVFALTGRTGSGCSTAANTLAKTFGQIALPDGEVGDVETRKADIVVTFARTQWVPFSTVTVSSVIFSFLLEESWENIEKLLRAQKVTERGCRELKEQLEYLRADPRYQAFETALSQQSTSANAAEAWGFFAHEVHVRAQQTKRVLAGDYRRIFQSLGDNIRFSGRALDSTMRPESLFKLMERVCSLVNCSVAAQHAMPNRPARVVIDAIRNPLELVYLRRHIPGLYVLAITVDDVSRRLRLIETGLSKKEVDELDKKEYPEDPSKKHLEDYTSFVSQNLKDCIQSRMYSSLILEIRD